VQVRLNALIILCIQKPLHINSPKSKKRTANSGEKGMAAAFGLLPLPSSPSTDRQTYQIPYQTYQNTYHIKYIKHILSYQISY